MASEASSSIPKTSNEEQIAELIEKSQGLIRSMMKFEIAFDLGLSQLDENLASLANLTNPGHHSQTATSAPSSQPQLQALLNGIAMLRNYVAVTSNQNQPSLNHEFPHPMDLFRSYLLKDAIRAQAESGDNDGSRVLFRGTPWEFIVPCPTVIKAILRSNSSSAETNGIDVTTPFALGQIDRYLERSWNSAAEKVRHSSRVIAEVDIELSLRILGHLLGLDRYLEMVFARAHQVDPVSSEQPSDTSNVSDGVGENQE